MTMLQQNDLLASAGSRVVDQNGAKVGTIEEIYIDRDSEQPEWALVNTGLFGTKSTFVPLAEASRDGDDLRVPYTTDQVKGAPKMDADGELSQQEEAEL